MKTNQVFTTELKSEAEKIISRYEQKRAALLPVLHLVQNTRGCISEDAEREAAELFGIPIVDIREIMTFYTLYRSKPCAKYQLNVCRTLSCFLAGGEEILGHLRQKLGISVGEQTKDGMFELHEVECLGACEIAPMMQLNHEYVGPLTKEKADQILEDLKQKGKSHEEKLGTKVL